MREGGSSGPGNPGGGGVKKIMPSVRGVWIFSGITHFMPSLRIMSTPGSHCEPPTNYIIEPLTFTASKMALRGKAIVFQSRFP